MGRMVVPVLQSHAVSAAPAHVVVAGVPHIGVYRRPMPEPLPVSWVARPPPAKAP